MGAPRTIPSCQRILRVRDHGLFPQKVQPEGLWGQSRAGNGFCKGQAETSTAWSLSGPTREQAAKVPPTLSSSCLLQGAKSQTQQQRPPCSPPQLSPKLGQGLAALLALH